MSIPGGVMLATHSTSLALGGSADGGGGGGGGGGEVGVLGGKREVPLA